MQKSSLSRRYVLLRPVEGQGTGFARIETLRGRCRTSIRVSAMPEEALRVLLLGGDETTGAVVDLGMMLQAGQGTATLYREDAAIPPGYHTLAVVSDWPRAELLLRGSIAPTACTLWQLQTTVKHYLRLPAPGSAPAPEKTPPRPPRKGVLLLRRRVCT